VAVLEEIWPPNHQLTSVSIVGVTDADDDPVTITVTGVTQDEPLNTVGDGNTCPDAVIKDGAVQVRMERTGTKKVPGNGRVYTISFTASDGQGGTCEGVVTACVPHDQGQGHLCVDDGQTVNSLGPCDVNKNGKNSANNEDLVNPGLSSAVPTSLDLRAWQPTGSASTLEFMLPYESDVSLAIFDISGRRIAMLDHSRRSAGTHQVSWNTTGVTRGVYFARLLVGRTSISKPVFVK